MYKRRKPEQVRAFAVFSYVVPFFGEFFAVDLRGKRRYADQEPISDARLIF